MEAIHQNTDDIVPGVVVKMYYPKSGLWHVAVVTSVQPDGFWVFEGNYNDCKTGNRFIPWGYYAIKAFYKP